MKKKILIIIGILIIIVIIGIAMYYITDQNQEENNIYINNYLSNLGYKYNEKDNIYQKITTNNTLDEFYNTVKNKQKTNYNEYYYSISNNNFIELNMAYNNGITEVINITSDLTKQELTFNYELSKDDSSALLEGSYNNNKYICKIVSLKKLKDESKDKYCNTIKNHLNIFIEEENKLITNEEFNKIINMPKKEVKIK